MGSNPVYDLVYGLRSRARLWSIFRHESNYTLSKSRMHEWMIVFVGVGSGASFLNPPRPANLSRLFPPTPPHAMISMISAYTALSTWTVIRPAKPKFRRARQKLWTRPAAITTNARGFAIGFH